MKFVFKWLKNKLSETERDQYSNQKVRVSIGESPSNLSKGTQFTIYRADGGHIVETRYIDQHHEWHTEMYIITSDQNFGERIEHILTYEQIKR
jgi:hypothetical protein